MNIFKNKKLSIDLMGSILGIINIWHIGVWSNIEKDRAIHYWCLSILIIPILVGEY